MVICAGFRNPAYTAKLASTLDVISGGRFELGIGAGWKEDEWLAYGYGFPPIGERMDAFGDALEVITRMLAPGRATFEGAHAHVRGAINVPKGIQQPRIPIIVGGNGERRTAGYAIRFADELNYVFLEPDEIRERIADVRARCEEEGRDPSTLRFSQYVRDEDVRDAGPGAGRPDRPARGGRPRPARRLPDALVADASRRRRRSPRTAGRPGWSSPGGRRDRLIRRGAPRPRTGLSRLLQELDALRDPVALVGDLRDLVRRGAGQDQLLVAGETRCWRIATACPFVCAEPGTV